MLDVPTIVRLLAWCLAGDSGHGGAGQGHVTVHNSPAHLQEVSAAAEVDCAGGYPEKGRAKATDIMHAAMLSSAATYKRVPEGLKAMSELPERRRVLVEAWSSWSTVAVEEDHGGDKAQREEETLRKTKTSECSR